MSSGQKMSLSDLADLYNSEQVQTNELRSQQILPLLFTHEDIKSALKNQSQVIKKIFKYETVAKLIGYLREENASHAELLKTVRYDPSGEEIPLCMKLPFMAMEILSCECQIINDLLFVGCGENLPLLPELLSFLDQPQHYHLASYFSRVLCAITKRVSSSNHKYNAYFSDKIIGYQNGELDKNRSSLYKAIKHLYSLTTIEYITKWLLISSKVKVKEDMDGEIFQKTIIEFRREFKHEFLLHLIQEVSTGNLDSEILNNIPALFEQMLSQSEKSNKIATSLMIKSLPQIPSGPKITLYDLAVHEEIVSQVFKSPEENCLNLAKIKLIKVYLIRYFLQLALLQKSSQEQGDKQLKLLQVMAIEHITHVVEWMFEQLKRLLNISKASASNETSPMVEKEEIEESRIRVTTGEKMLILHLLEVLRQIHGLQSYRPQLVEFYNINSSDLVRLIKRLMSLDNNLIQLETSKLVLSMLKPNEKPKDSLDLPCDFARKLLASAITDLIEVNSAQCHVIEWADIILSLESKHIFENYQEEFQWDHVREIVEETKRIRVGEYRLIQSNIDWFYSEEKALLKYSSFLNDFKVQIVYEDKKEAKQPVSEKKTPPSASAKKIQEAQQLPKEPKQSNPTSIPAQSSPSDSLNLPEPHLHLFKNNYLQYDVNSLLSEL